MENDSPQSLVEEFKKQKYQFDSETGLCNLPEDTKSDYDNALKILSEQLYSKDIHFIFELIQNAEDNHYADSLTPELSFELLADDPTNTPGCKGCLVIRNNEVGFNIKNIKAISSIGKSTKANQKDAGYIGDKGIGFKSVFVVSPSPHILSNGFKIKFLKDDPVTGLGYIVPYWLAENFSSFDDPKGTVLLLPLLDRKGNETGMYQKIHTELTKFYSEIVLFLKKLKKLSIKTPDFYATYEAKKRGEHVELSVNSTEGSTVVEYMMRSQKVVVPESAKNDLRENVTQREVSLAFPMGFELKESPLFCYLPTESDTGLSFLVNADFILSASRESIRQDLTWNDWLRDEVASFAAKSLANILSEKGIVERWKWVPTFNSNRVIYWDCVRDKVNIALQNTKCIPTLSGDYQLPANCLKLGGNYKFLTEWPLAILERLEQDLFWNDSPWLNNVVNGIGIKNFSENQLVGLLRRVENNDELTNEQLIAALIELTTLKGKWGGARKYDKYLADLRSCNLFRCDSGLHNSKYKNLFLPSADKYEVPVLANHAGETTQPSYIDKNFYRLMPQHLQNSVKAMFRIEEVNVVSYLRNSVVRFLKDNTLHCTGASLEKLNKYLIENVEVIPEETIVPLKDVLPFKSNSGVWVIKNELTKFVAPYSFYESPIWQSIYTSEEELKHIVVLHHDYVKWCGQELAEGFLDAFEISDFVSPFIISLKNDTSFLATPKSFLDPLFWQHEHSRKSTFEWLYKVYNDEEIKITSIKGKLNLDFFILNEPWLLSTDRGVVKPSSTLHAFSQSERSIFGNSLNYLVDQVQKQFARKIGLTTEPTPRGFMDQITVEKDKPSPNLDFLGLAYEALSNWKDVAEIERIKKRLSKEQLIYIPRDNEQWTTVEEAVWENTPELSNSFTGLSSYLPEKLKLYFIETLGIKSLHSIASYFKAYQALELKNKKLEPEEESILNALVRKITHYVKSENYLTNLDWNNFFANLKVYTTFGKWREIDSNLYLADDGKVKELFKDSPDVDFIWSNSSQFYGFFDAIGVKRASENIEVLVGNVENIREHSVLNIQLVAKKAICLFVADHLTLDEDNQEKLTEFFHSEEYSCDKLSVEYSLEQRSHINVTHELGIYDQGRPGIVIVANNDIEDIKYELAASIARFYFGKQASRYEKDIRLYLNIQSEERLDKVIKNDALELDDDKSLILNGIFTNAIDYIQDEVNSPTVSDSPMDESTVSEQHETGEIEQETEEGIGIYTDLLEDVSPEEETPEDLPSIQSAETRTSEFPEDNNRLVPPDHVVQNDIVGDDIQKDNIPNIDDGGEFNNPTSIDAHGDATIIGETSNEGHKKFPSDQAHGQQNNWNPPNSPQNKNKSHERTKKQFSTGASPGYRFLSYVESDKTHDRAKRDERNDQEFGYKAELYVRDWLKDKGYEVELFGGTNKGFDLTAIDPNTGELKFVEVKGIRGNWNRTGVAISQSQMEKCLQEADNYWFIVVENMLSKPVMHEFVNPAKLIDRYYFDGNWSKISEKSIITIEPQKIDIDDLIFDDDCKLIYKNILEENIKIPEIGFELSDDRFEVIAELEFAWADEKIGIYIEEPLTKPEGWNLYSIEEVQADFSILEKQNLVNKDDECYPA